MRSPAALFLLLPLAAAGADKWRLQYFHDEDETSLNIVDLKFPSAERGVAVGFLTSKRSVKPVCLLTSDGGKSWARQDLKEPPVSLFFLNDSLGWLVTEKKIWITEESGRSWRKLNAPGGILQVYFLDSRHGFAAGVKRQLYETKDGGEHWEKFPQIEGLKANPEHTTFAAIHFADSKVGLIAGNTRPPRRHEQEHPDWVDPEAAVLRRQWPSVGVLLETRDGGGKWTPSSASIFGRISRARLSPDGWGLALLEYDDYFDYPSDVLFLNWKTGKNISAYKEKRRRITDLAIAGAKGPVYLGGVETTGKLTSALIPGKVRMVRSLNALQWDDQDVDYRAVARRVTLAAVDADHVWAATDTGMILKLEREQ
jgi:photosynthesis system II assembly factor YCF48-like protein